MRVNKIQNLYRMRLEKFNTFNKKCLNTAKKVKNYIKKPRVLYPVGIILLVALITQNTIIDGFRKYNQRLQARRVRHREDKLYRKYCGKQIDYKG